jgi:hypothetical protein
MAHTQHTPSLAHLEEALTVLFCLIDDAYALLNPHGARRYESIKRLSDSEVITLALLQQLRGVESQRSFLRDAEILFSSVCGDSGTPPFLVAPAGEKAQGLRMEPLRREILPELLVGDPETVLIDSTLLEVLHPRQVPKVGGFLWSSVGKVGILLGVRGEATLALRHQPHSPLLRA